MIMFFVLKNVVRYVFKTAKKTAKNVRKLMQFNWLLFYFGVPSIFIETVDRYCGSTHSQEKSG